MTQAHTPAEKVDQLLTLRSKIEAQIRVELAKVNAEPPRKRSRHIVPDCGTESAYQRHKHYAEEVDAACRDAHRLNNRLQYARARYGEAS